MDLEKRGVRENVESKIEVDLSRFGGERIERRCRKAHNRVYWGIQVCMHDIWDESLKNKFCCVVDSKLHSWGE